MTKPQKLRKLHELVCKVESPDLSFEDACHDDHGALTLPRILAAMNSNGHLCLIELGDNIVLICIDGKRIKWTLRQDGRDMTADEQSEETIDSLISIFEGE